MGKAEEMWDKHSRNVQEDAYDIEEVSWVIGQDVMLKQDFLDSVKSIDQENKELREKVDLCEVLHKRHDTKYIQAVSMKVTQKQFDRDLKSELIRLGYEKSGDTADKVTPSVNGPYEYLCTTIDHNGDLWYGILHKNSHNKFNRFPIDHYNPKLFLEMAALKFYLDKYRLFNKAFREKEELEKIIIDQKNTMKTMNERLITKPQDND